MQLEINPTFTDRSPVLHGDHVSLLLPPPIGKGYWWLRVPLSENQAIVAFPKFGTVGVGFEVEEDWNTNLPYTCSATAIYRHIDHNKGDDAISDADCVAAIELIQQAIADLWAEHSTDKVEEMRQREAAIGL